MGMRSVLIAIFPFLTDAISTTKAYVLIAVTAT
jgi:hypothetical protein